MMSSSKRRLVDLKVNDNIIIPVPRVDRGPIDCRNIRGIIVDKTVNGYKIGTTVGVISGLLSRNQIEKIHGHELTILDVPDNTEISVRKAVQLLSLYGGQGHIHCSCRSGCKTGKCKCKRTNILCNSRCHASCHVPTNEFQETFNASMRYVFLDNKCLKNSISLIKFDLNLKKFQSFYL